MRRIAEDRLVRRLPFDKVQPVGEAVARGQKERIRSMRRSIPS